MLRWIGQQRAREPPDISFKDTPALPGRVQDGEVTDDPLAAIDMGRKLGGQRKIYSVSRINPLYNENSDYSTIARQAAKPKRTTNRASRQCSPSSGDKSNSSGYGGSHGGHSSLDQIYGDNAKPTEEAIPILEQNAAYVKSIKIARGEGVNNKSVPSNSSSSGAGTLTTIPEGRVDFIPKPIWPYYNDVVLNTYDSLVDDALLLYTSYTNKNLIQNGEKKDISIRDVLLDLLTKVNATMEGKTGITPEQMLKLVNDRLALSLEAMRHTSDEEMRRLCVNLSNSKKVTSVVRALNNSNFSSCGNSSQSSPEWSSGRQRTSSSETEDFYQVPSGSSSSEFSDSLKDAPNPLPVFVHEDLTSVPNGVRNAMIYGTLCRGKVGSANEKLTDKEGAEEKKQPANKKSLLRSEDNRPSVWQQYYGVRAVAEGEVKCAAKPTDVPLFPGGRPEADFTLDISRSEMLTKRMKKDKKWRCRCRLLTSFLGLVFFLLSVMAVSLMLTRGKRMFGSMV